MQKLYTTEVGSKLYGTSTPTSDTDFKTVFLPELASLLRGRGVKNIVHTTGDSKTKNSAEDVDHEYVPLQVLADDFLGGQTYAVELVFSVTSADHHAKTVHDDRFVEFCDQLSKRALTSNIKAMIGYAMGQTHKYGVKGTRLSSVRKFNGILDTALTYMMSTGLGKLPALDTKLSDVHVDVNTTLAEWVKAEGDKYILNTTYEGPNDTRLPCVSVIEKLFPLEIRLGEAMHRGTNMLGAYGSRAAEAESNKGVDWKAVSHALRICYEAIDVLEKQRLEFPLSPERVELLLKIRRAELPWVEVEELLADAMDKVDAAKAACTLPATDQVLADGFEQWLNNWLFLLYFNKTEME